jgi:hypothetical protein
MEPEIARRCLDCGASVRGGSFFCPQCGKALKAGEGTVSSAAAETTPEAPARRQPDAESNAPVVAHQGSEAGPAHGGAPAPAEMPARPAATEGRPRAEIITDDERDMDGRSRRRRVTAAARETVEDKLAPRVEKLRHASNVMLEEAAYDPSLRFVLVAIVVILLSLLVLLLNYMLG